MENEKIIILCAFITIYSNGILWENQCESNGFTLIKDSEHFEVCKKSKTDDGLINNVKIDINASQGVLESLEKVFTLYIDSLGWMLPFPSSKEKN